jgi:SHS2 domain-containing protein
MGQFATFDHTADIGLRIEADSLEDLFETAAEGLVSLVVTNPQSIEADAGATSDAIDLVAEDPTELLLAYLSAILIRIETQHRVFTRSPVVLFGDGVGLRAMLRGEAIDPNRHVLDHEVKAVTRHGAFIRREGDRWVAELVLDI